MLYAVIPLQLPDLTILSSKIKSLEIPVYESLAPSVYFVSYKGTTQELSAALGYGDDKTIGTGVVLPVSNYFGYAPKDLWEWLRIQDHGD